jgi:hypothetical protein
MTTKKMMSKLMVLGFGLIAAGLMLIAPVKAHANQIVNPPIPRSQPAPVQQRYNWSYGFESGMNYRYDLGKPTVWNGVVPQDVYTANVRRDANVSYKPPGPRTGNTITPTDPSNWAFTRQQNQLHQNGFWNPVELQNPNVMSRYDLTQQGVNSQPQGNPMGIQTNVQTNGASQAAWSSSSRSERPDSGGSGGFLPPTSINGN